jgi:signal transduction histidine kinase
MPFMQAESNLILRKKGVGLGLSFVKVVAEKHGGAVFTLNLPCVASLSP